MTAKAMLDYFFRPVWQWKKYSYSYRIAVWMGHLWHERLTKPGQYLVAAAVTSAIAGSFPEVMVGSYTFSFFLSLTILALLLTAVRRPRVTVIRMLPDRCVAGSSVPLRITVRNLTRRALWDIGAFEYRLPAPLDVPDEVQFIPSLAAGGSHTFEYLLTAARRGSYNLPGPTALSTFPFGLAQSRRFSPDPRRLIVYPPFHHLRELELPTSQRYQPGGIVLTSNVGESMEFIGNREYRPGDRLRDLHPRSWARVGYPVVKQYQEEFLTRVAILVDTYVPPGIPLKIRRKPNPNDPLEANLSMAAAISDYLARQEYIVDLFAASRLRNSITFKLADLWVFWKTSSTSWPASNAAPSTRWKPLVPSST